MKAPNFKLQHPKKFQAPCSNKFTRDRLDVWSLIPRKRDWSLELFRMNSIQVDIKKLQHELDSLALITEAAPPVVTRVLFSEADLRGRAFVKNLCRKAGLVLREDAVGNIFAR